MISATNYLVTVHSEREEVLAIADLIEPCGHKRIRYISSNWAQVHHLPLLESTGSPTGHDSLPPPPALSYRNPDAIQQMTASIPPDPSQSSCSEGKHRSPSIRGQYHSYPLLSTSTLYSKA